MTDHAHDEVYIGKVKFGGDLVSDARPPEHAVFVIAECGSSWRFGDDHLANAYRMIEAAKEAGADCVKFQWCSDWRALAKRRGVGIAAGAEAGLVHPYSFVEYDREWLKLMKAHADKVGIEYMVTAFLPVDVAVIAPLVKRFKVAAKEAGDEGLSDAIDAVRGERQIIVSHNPDGALVYDSRMHKNVTVLHCISKYPTPIDEIGMAEFRQGDCEECYWERKPDGYSDHSANVLAGAVAVGAGARVIEVHFKLGGFRSLVVGAGLPYERVHNGTPEDNPDFPHSHTEQSLKEYVQNIRTAERMM